MENNFRLQICKSIINYLLESTNYTLKDIATLLNCSIRQLHSIYFDELMPTNLSYERDLVGLYHLILELNTNKQYVHQGFKWACI
ncbi:Uncharacterised protein [Legionella bozemanae]|uniref:HTH araC/xylS-type domain-containing protein n=1 Tax=Legionella bozemanae TaxID=447 RepID=A0A0W0RPY8_LEGBO|nr:hypothetical protein Lboz_1779 [Legionella bozemanae]STP14076.1 Uncharacterised protein [Legionella bozemanae]